MRKILLSTANAEENRVAVVENNLLTDYLSVYAGQEDRRGSIYVGTIEEVETSLDACFVNIGDSKKGFLQFNDIDAAALGPGSGSIADRLHSGASVLVQITKDSRSEKGPLLTTRIKLSSNNLLLMPREKDKTRLHLSRRADESERQRIEQARDRLQAPEGQSLIVRSNAFDKAIEDLIWERVNLLSLWSMIQKIAQKQEKPTLLYEYQNIVNICLSEYLSQDIEEIVCDNERTQDEVKENLDAIGGLSPERVRLIKGDELLFDDGMVKQFDALVTRKVALRSGGEMVIDTTEAMVTIDVNSKRSRGQSNIENTAFNTNMEAASELATQLKLRNLAGLIVVDFIDMSSEENRAKLENHVRREFRKDRAKTNIGSLSQFGLLEMTRQNIGRPLHESHSIVCHHCSGTGRMPTVRSTALNLLDKIRAACIGRKQVGAIVIEMAIDPATYLLNEKRAELHEILVDFGIEVLIVPSANLDRAEHKMRVEKNKRTSYARHSYEQDISSEIKSDYLAQQAGSQKSEPVAAITSSDVRKSQQPRPSTQAKEEPRTEKGIFRSLVSSLFSTASKGATAAKTNGGKKTSRGRSGSINSSDEDSDSSRKRRRSRSRGGRGRSGKPGNRQQQATESSNGKGKETEGGSGKRSKDSSSPSQAKRKPKAGHRSKPEAKPEPRSEAKPAAKPESKSGPTPSTRSSKSSPDESVKAPGSDKPEGKSISGSSATMPSPRPAPPLKTDAPTPDPAASQMKRGRGSTVRRST